MDGVDINLEPGIISIVRTEPDLVYDGDTLEVEVLRVAKIRIRGLYCPEVRTKDREEKARGIAARDYLRGLIQEGIDRGAEFIIRIPTGHADDVGDITSLGRVLADLFIDGQNVADLMVAAGHGTRNKE